MDQPNARKAHVTPRPLVGGIGMVTAISTTSYFLVPQHGLLGFFSGLTLLALVGFVDDFREIGHRPKFLAQIIAAILLITLSDTVLYSFGDLLGLGDIAVPTAWLAMVVTVFCVVGVCNSINMIDGLDGLAGGVSFVAFVAFAAHGAISGQTTLMLLSLAFAGALLGFLRFNWRPASLFMGDAGSLCLGFALSFMAIGLTQGESGTMQPAAALLILAIPITDTLTLMTKRVMKGHSPFKADRNHLHHIFVRYGFSRKRAVKIIIGLTILTSSCSLLGPVYQLADSTLFLIFASYFALVFLSSFFVVNIARFSLKFKRQRESCDTGLCQVVRSTIILIDHLGFFRKAKRYPVELPVICRTGRDQFSGTVLDISRAGFMARIPEMRSLKGDVEVEIDLPFFSGLRIFQAPATNLWLDQDEEGRYNHGFCFQAVTSKQVALLARFIEMQKKSAGSQNGAPLPAPVTGEMGEGLPHPN
ncbi:MAG: PilZ domain-containing protein [Thermodesulfobacteriota bacterium]